MERLEPEMWSVVGQDRGRYFEGRYSVLDENICDCGCCHFCHRGGFTELREPIRHYHDDLIAVFRLRQPPEDIDSDKY